MKDLMWVSMGWDWLNITLLLLGLRLWLDYILDLGCRYLLV